MKKIVLATIVAGLAMLNACQHQPIIPPSTTTTGNNPPPPPPPPPTSNCNPDTVYFENDILPLLISSCGMPGCHDAISHQEGLNVTTYASLMSSGKVKAGNPNGSKLIEAVNETDPKDVMPQPPLPKLSTDQIAKLTKWIQQGARNNKCNSGCDTTKFTFAADVKPLLDANCKGCHNTNLASGGVKLDTYADVKMYADNGKLYGTANWQAGYKPMPQGGSKLPLCQVTILRKWIQAGALNN